MTDEQMSRRARRAYEEELEAAAESGALAAPPQLAGSASPDSAEMALSRRDRRRLERVDSPVEVWTAEEEMIATGQIPKVTPDVIAQQERVARERAAQIQAEATAASAEIRRVSMHDVDPARVTAVTAAMAASAPTPTLQNLFPPGSLQARAFAEQLAREQADAADATAGATNQGGPGAGQADAGDDAAEEIRRLTAAAMASMERVAPPADGTPPTPSALPTRAAPAAQTAAAASWAAQLEPTTGSYAIPGLAPNGSATQPPATGSVPLSYEQSPPSGAPLSGPTPSGSPLPGPPPSGSIPAFPPPTGGVPTLAAQSGAIPTGQFSAIPPVAPQVPGPQVTRSPWEAHPLDSAPIPQVGGNLNAPAQKVPVPDFSALIAPGAATFNPGGPGAAPAPNPFAPEAPRTATGGIPRVATGNDATTVQRRAVELQPAGGARHLRGAHYAVLGALMFALGVVVVQVVRLNS